MMAMNEEKMARNPAAIAESCAPVPPTLAGMARGSQASPQTFSERLKAAEPMLRRLVPSLALVFVVVIGIAFTLQSITIRNETLTDSAGEIELISAYVTSELTASLAGQKLDSPKSVTNIVATLGRILPEQHLRHGAQVYIADEQSTIVATAPAKLGISGTISSRLGQSQPITVLAENAGVVAITLPDGSKAIAMARNIGNKGALAIVVQPVTQALQRWKDRTAAAITLFAATALVMAGLAIAFFWQSWRVKKADDAVQKVRERIDTALSRGRCGLWDWDIARGSLYWSDSMYEMLGYQRVSEFLAFGEINDLIHPDDENLYVLAQRLADHQETAVDHSFRIRSANGEWVWVRARAELILDQNENRLHLVGIAVDMSDQRRLEAENLTANLRLREAIEAFGESFVLWDADNRLVMCNSRFQKLHKLALSQVQAGTPYQEIAPYLTTPTHHSAAELTSETEIQSGNYIVQMPDNRWLQLNERRTRDGGYVSVGTDITQLKDAERRQTQMISDLKRSRQALEKQTAQLNELAQRYLEQKAEAEGANRAKSEFLAKMSHDLRTPLNAILGFSEIMEKEMFGPLGHEKYHDYCNDISKSGQSLLAVIADILDMAELEAGKVKIERQTLPIDKTLHDAFAAIRKEADLKGVVLVDDMTASGTLYADPRAINRILGHLLKNAVKFTPAGGRVTMSSRIVSGALNIYVDDTGVGIPRDALPKLAKPFTWVDLDSTKPSEGSGLGLAIARSFTELHGGGLHIRSNEGLGTNVLVHLPLRDAPNRIAA